MDVRLPDGTIVRNVPDNITKAELVAKLKSNGMDVSGLEEPKEGTTLARGAQMVARGMAAPVAGAIAGLPFGPVGSIVGSIAAPLIGSDVINRGLTALGMPQPESQMERALVAGGGALGGAGGQLGALSQLATSAASPVAQGIAQTLSQQPVRQLAAAVPAGAVGQAVAEETQSPMAGMVAGALTALPFGIGATPPRTPATQVAQQAEDLYGQLRGLNVEVNQKAFQSSMKSLAGKLRKEGYTPTGFPVLKGAIQELTNNTQPKTFDELQALRNVIAAAQGSNNAAERRLASILKDEFDSYIVNIPKRDVVARTPTGQFQTGQDVGQIWESARGTYARLKKSEVFQNMLENAQLDQSKFTQSGAENSLAQQLRQLAKNQKQMRLFTSEEQQAIRDAAKGGTTQNMLKFFGRFAPTGPVSGIFAGGATVASPVIGAGITAGTTAARMGASAMRRRAVEDLIEQMLTGKRVQQPSVAATMATRGALSAPPLGLLFPYGE